MVEVPGLLLNFCCVFEILDIQSRTEKVGQVLLRNLAKIELSKPGLLE
jgi:hypothetical protein